MKSFAIQREAGNPASRQWIETRFFTRQQGEWAGYSYQWNDEQTDATLVDAPGLDQAFEVKDACLARRSSAKSTGTIPAAPSAWSATLPAPTSCSACRPLKNHPRPGLRQPRRQGRQSASRARAPRPDEGQVRPGSVKLLEADAKEQGLNPDAELGVCRALPAAEGATRRRPVLVAADGSPAFIRRSSPIRATVRPISTPAPARTCTPTAHLPRRIRRR